jgi:acyl-CoA synthetase (AMP-forming)/AMP-acid ligase II
MAMETMGAGFQQTYGQTESGVIVTVLDEDDHRRGLAERREALQSCGRPIAGYEVRIVDDDGADVPAGRVGELIVRGESLMEGYLHRPDATAKALRDGWLYTGDLARVDEGGLVFLVDRRNDLIISGGENIYPIEIEHVISAHPDVLDVAVIGVPDDKWGEAVKAVVSLRPGASSDEQSIQQWCRSRLGGFKVPKTVDRVDVVPRNASGKLLKKQLRDPYWAGRERHI